MGFTGARVYFHKQLFYGEPTELFTLVAHRTNAKGPLFGQLEQAPLPAGVLRVKIDCATIASARRQEASLASPCVS